MPKEAKEVGFAYRSRVADEAWEVADEMQAALGSEAVRFPGESTKSASGAGESAGDNNFLIVDPFKIKKFAPAGRYQDRDAFSVELLRRLGYLRTREDIQAEMQGAQGNLVITLPHRALPYKAQMLVHNMGHSQYLISGFVISPK